MILYCKLNGVWTAIPAITGENAYQIALKNGDPDKLTFTID